jgi:hypothetical protein
LAEKVNNTPSVYRTIPKEVFMLSKVLATLVATSAVAFAGYTFVCDHSSHCCSGSMPAPTAVSSESCCESALPSCCEGSSTIVTDAACPAAKAAAGATTVTTEAPK